MVVRWMTLLCICAVITTTTVLAQPVEKLRFAVVSHIGANDPNMKWLTLALEEFERRFPEVDTSYVSTNDYSIQDFVRLLEQVISTHPDGIAIPIVSANALEVPLRRAIERGIPVIAFNIPDDRPIDKRIPYLTYVGGDEYLTGKRLGEHALAKAAAGETPALNKVVCAIHDPAHQGLKARCRGMKDAVTVAGVKFQELFIGAEPTTARNSLRSYLLANKDANYIFTVASWSAPWAWSVAKDLKLDPDVDAKGVTIMTVDVSPVALAGIARGHLLSTVSQGFWMQGYLPAELLYWHARLGYAPQSDILTGPLVIDAANVAFWEKRVRAIFGDAYDSQITW